MSKSNTPVRSVIKVVSWITSILVLTLVLMILMIRIPAVQAKLADFASNWQASKTGAELSVEHLYLTFRGDLQVEHLSLATSTGDTLLYSSYLEIGASIPALLDGDISLTRINWQGVVANIEADSSGRFNFQFIVDAFDTGEPQEYPESVSSPKLEIGTISLKNIEVRYHDALNQIDINAIVEELQLVPEQTKLDQLLFHIRSGELTGALIEVTQFGRGSPSLETSSSTHLGPDRLPEIIVDALAVENVGVRYTSMPDSIFIETKVGNAGLETASLDLNENRVKGQLLSIDDTEFSLDISSSSSEATENSDAVAFVWPDWYIDLSQMEVNNSKFDFDLGSKANEPLFVDPNQMNWQVQSIEVADIHFAPYDAQFSLNELQLTEVNQDLRIIGQLEAQLNQGSIAVDNLKLATSDSKLDAQLKLSYPSFDSLLIDPLSTDIFAEIKELQLGSTDLWQLSPLLADQPSLRFLLEEDITSSGTIEYSKERISVNPFTASWSDQTRLFIDGQIDYPLDSSLFKLVLPRFQFSTEGRDLNSIKSAFDLPVDLPSRIALDGNLTASPNTLDGQVNLNSSEGRLDIRTKVTNALSTPDFSAETNFMNIDLGKWLDTDQLGKVNGSLEFEGQGKTLNDLTGDAHLLITSISLMDKELDSIGFDIELDGGDYELELLVAEPSMTVDLAGWGKFISAEEFTVDLQVALERFDLEGWNITEDSILVSSNIDLNLKRSTDQNSLLLEVTDSKFLSTTDEHLLRPITADLSSTSDSLSLRLSSGLLSAYGHVNTSINDLLDRSAQLSSHSTQLDKAAIDKLLEGLVASTHLRFHPTSDEFERIWPQIDVADTARLELTVNQPTDDYQLHALIPDVTYKLHQLNKLEVIASNNMDTLNYQLRFEELDSGPAKITDLSLSGQYIDQKLYHTLHIEGPTDHPIVNLSTASRWSSDTIYTHVVSKGLILDSLSWTLPRSNQLIYHNGGLRFEDFELTHDNDLLEISSPVTKGSELDLRFENFQIGTLTSILNASDNPATGEINGYVDINESNNERSILADLSIKDLRVLDQDLGLLKWKSQSDQSNGSLIDLNLNSPEIDIAIDGSLARDGALNLQMSLEKIAMSVIEGLSSETLSNSQGYIGGNMRIGGYDSLLDYSGSINFHGASFVVTDINAPFTLADESITIDNENISFENFTIRDEQDNLLQLNGKITTDDISDPLYDFKVTGQNFQLLNSTVKDNDLYYGKVAIDLDLAVKGRQSAPTVDVSARLNAGSNLTYVLPESQLEIEEREGVVMFFNQNDSSTLNETIRTQPKILDIQGIELRSKLAIDPETNFKMIIDKRSGDYLEIGGEANLDINIDRNGKTTMSGIYTARKGAYEVRLYEIVQRRFEVVPGSRIIWSGDPYRAELDLTAQYNLRASVKELMEEQVANADPTTKVSSQQDLPFEVLLGIQGSLEQPLMSFRLEMPVGVRNELGGNIYARINQINENEDELNKQVFSLIAFNQFLPSAVTSAAGSTTANIAKSSVNQILSSQLNNLSRRYIKGIDVDFNLNSFSDYQSGSPSDRTELSVSVKKALFDDRVIISVGNSVDLDGQTRQSNEWVADVSVEYLLTGDGRYRLKGFQKNSFEDLVEGQVIITGLSLLFRKEFNQFRNIFNGTEETK